MGLMATFMSAVAAASTTVAAAGKNVGAVLKGFVEGAGQLWKTAKQKLREYRLFAKEKGKAAKDKMVAQMATLVEKVQKQLSVTLEGAAALTGQLVKYGKVAWAKLTNLHRTMQKLLPQIRYWLRTGRVAKNKIISLHIPELYAIVRGKIGKTVEFGLTWGITRLRGGFLVATMATDKGELHDSKFAVRAVKDHMAIFGKPPRQYAYDRGGWSRENVAALKKLGVKDVGLAPRGRAKWAVCGQARDMLVKERSQIEAGIGSLKCGKYGLNRPMARSIAAMGVCAQRAVLGFNLAKLVRGLANRDKIVLVG
jgi:hypothetical protein